MNTLSLYIHIPFCIKKCAYCDFLSAPVFEYAGAYFAALVQEILSFDTDREIYSIFIGGGTPSAVNEKYITRILDVISKKYALAPDCEITLESNPGTLTEEKL
ncbi:MAG: coproporphyrinogen III oxidase, partial [Firmicutes bacterium]|nr:coproporphyrinogen III oxidase [Bacillota bacterium]